MCPRDYLWCWTCGGLAACRSNIHHARRSDGTPLMKTSWKWPRWSTRDTDWQRHHCKQSTRDWLTDEQLAQACPRGMLSRMNAAIVLPPGCLLHIMYEGRWVASFIPPPPPPLPHPVQDDHGGGGYGRRGTGGTGHRVHTSGTDSTCESIGSRYSL